MECRFKKIRCVLDELGYYQKVSPESVPLVERLVADLKTTTESLQKYMKISQSAIEERNNLQIGAEPYKCDNARLVKDCNDLHLALMRNREQNQQIQKELQGRLEQLKAENFEHISETTRLKKRIRELEVELVDRGEILLNSKPKNKTSLSTNSAHSKSPRKSRNFEINSTMALADQKILNLTKDIKKLKEHNMQLIESNEILQSQLTNRDREIDRLNMEFEGGRPLNAIRKDCCCNKENHYATNVIHDDLNKLKHEKNALELRLKEALAKQHEAMKRALHLAERNKLLEKEMKDIDHLAMAVETECNNTVKCNAEKVNRLQDRMHGTVLQIQTLERENAKLKQEKQELSADLDAVLLEKKHLQTVLETSLDEKKRLSDRINNFTIIEQDLNLEIDRLTRLSAEQKRKIAELECSLVSEKVLDKESTPEADEETSKKVPKKSKKVKGKRSKSPGKASTKKSNAKHEKTANKKSVSVEISLDQPKQGLQAPANSPKSACNCDCESSKQLKELLEKELIDKHEQTARFIENLRTEKEYYMKEYHKILEQVNQIPLPTARPSSRSLEKADLAQKLLETEKSLSNLRHENKILSQEKFNLLSRLETARDRPETDMEGLCLKTTCKRTERECSLLRADLDRLEEERDSFKLKLKNLSESQIHDTDRYKKALAEAEDQIKRLELERRELMQSQGTRRTTITGLEDQCDTLKDQLRNAQSELNHQKALYTQLKTLHEQTDRALMDTQSKLTNAETELASMQENLKKRDLDRGIATKEVDMLKSDVQIIKSQLALIDKEKDELLVALDDKTEKLAMLEMDIKSKDKTIASLESMLNEMKRKMSLTIDENASQEHLYRTSQNELVTLRQDLESTRRIKESALDENRRLQDDLAAVTCDNRDARKELELYKRQVDDLKTQLQHYVAEVKRTEDLISNKEIERNELLDQFRSLSQEANILENNNHTLETEASQSKVQLSVALDHAADLEHRIQNKDSIIASYEKQISELTSQIASLEIQLRQFMTQYETNERELQNMRDLCLKLDTDNAKYKRQMRDREDQTLQLDRNVEQLRSERELLQHNLIKDKRNAETMEKFLDDAKSESSELKLLNQDLQEEVQRLKIQLQEIKDRLSLCPCTLKMDVNKRDSNKIADKEMDGKSNGSSRESVNNGNGLPCPCMGLNKLHQDCFMNFYGSNKEITEGIIIFSSSKFSENTRSVANCTLIHEKHKD